MTINISKFSKYIFLALLLLAVIGVLGCASSEESSLPWSQPEPWEQQPQMGVPF
jgi:hypothetical protein